ncbi:hypothetical protein [Arsukibacterium sp.]|uniref:hypothetical protein n=1 Tax=Arsukibacterium sp. TaxID=1977258 RepID=UPI00299F39E2|nr:hypothetical protein [Arsukibacterium sp.]MDX1536535.1 hypothetical protein [Arsukibacterium sp.]
MEEITVTWKLAIKVWWSWFWRMFIWAIPAALCVGFFIGMVSAMVGFSLSEYGLQLNLIGVLIGMFFGIYAMKTILNIRFNGYRIALIKTDDGVTAIDA